MGSHELASLLLANIKLAEAFRHRQPSQAKLSSE
jgi:hypothetical protein